mgnify:CR=1 FL=1
MAWLADRGDKAWGERWFLVTTPIWIAAVAIVMFTGWLRAWSDAGYLAFSCFAAAPAVLGPLLTARGRDFSAGVPYWVKLNLYAAILVFFGTYVGTHYFFDLMGMRYAFPSRWTFEALHVGKSGERVPVFMYPLTQAYFVTYFTVLVVAYRKVTSALRLGLLGRVAAVLVLSYAIAFAETFFMATDLLAGLFSYEKRDKMLALGSFGYAAYFVVGLPLARPIDEAEATPVSQVTLRALAACMAIFFLLELWARAVGRL